MHIAFNYKLRLLLSRMLLQNGPCKDAVLLPPFFSEYNTDVKIIHKCEKYVISQFVKYGYWIADTVAGNDYDHNSSCSAILYRCCSLVSNYTSHYSDSSILTFESS
jgi:hypothetical protein